MKIYDREGFPNPARVRIVLSEKNLDSQIEFVSVDLISAEHKQPAFLKLNPSGVIPVLQLDDGTLISECTAITEYLDNLDGNPVLTGRLPKEKAMIHMMQRKAESEIIDSVGLYFHHATPGLGKDLEAYKSPEWTGRKEWGLKQRDVVLKGLSSFNKLLQNQSYLAGPEFSMADITLFSGLMFAEVAGIAIPEELSNIHNWRVRVSERPSVKNRTGQNLLLEDLKKLGFA